MMETAYHHTGLNAFMIGMTGRTILVGKMLMEQGFHCIARTGSYL
jgi:hypothetical protein